MAFKCREKVSQRNRHALDQSVRTQTIEGMEMSKYKLEMRVKEEVRCLSVSQFENANTIE
jgi:hypothetical protein